MRYVIGMGGNVGDVRAAFAGVPDALERDEDVRVLARSSLYRTRAVGPPQPDYLNAAVLVDARCAPRELLRRCQAIEAEAGRDRKHELRWGPRPLDLDLLIGNGIVCRGPDLELPHPRLAERAFALVPASEVAPDWMHPSVGRSLGALARETASRCAGDLQCLGSM